MAGKLERVMWEMNSFIKNAELKEKFQEIYKLVVEENKGNVGAFIPVGRVDEDRLDLNDLTIFEDYEIRSGTRKTAWGDEVDSEAEYTDYLAKKADEEYKDWSVIHNAEYNVWHLIENPDEPEDVYSEHDSQAEAEDELVELKEDWIESQTEWDELDMEYHEVYWNTVWRFNGDLDQEVADRVGLGYLEHLSSGDEYLFLLGCGMDLSPKISAYQALAFGYVDEQYIHHFTGDVRYTKHVMGNDIWNEVIEKLEIAGFYESEVSE